MTRPQQGQVFNTATNENETNEQTAQNAEQQQQTGVNNYQSAISQYASKNPYVQGGEAQTAQNQVTANTSDAAAAALKANLEQQAQRTGQNPNAANATASTGAQAIARNLGAQQGADTASRIGSEAGYNQNVLSATGQVPGMEGQIASEAGGQANAQLGTAEQAANTPSFADMLTQSLIGAGGELGGAAIKKCWVAAEVFGGWYEPRTVIVREYLFGPFREHRLGRLITDLYAEYGERAAALMKRNRPARWVLTRLCHLALRQAGRK